MKKDDTPGAGSAEAQERPGKRRRFGTSFQNQFAGLAYGGGPLFLTVVLAFMVMAAVCLAVFFMSVQGEERVMVPTVVGKPLTTALLEMQAKELYAKIVLRYSDVPGEEGRVLAQEPEAGSIVKAYRRVTLTVSRGVAIDRVEDYVGKNIDAVQPRLQTLFSGTDVPMRLAPPVYMKDGQPAGTIIAQHPPVDTPIDDADQLVLIVSSGSETPAATVPDIRGMTVRQVLQQMGAASVVFDFSSHEATAAEAAGTVTSQEAAGQEVEAYRRVAADFAFPRRTDEDADVYGIFSYTLTAYPYPVPVTLELSDDQGNTTELVRFNHPGEKIFIPYVAKRGSILTLYVLDILVAQETVQ